MNNKCVECMHYSACRRMLEKTGCFNFPKRYTMTKNCDHYVDRTDYVSASLYNAVSDSYQVYVDRIHNQRKELERLYDALKRKEKNE